jgi:hypothetical protein
MTVDWTLIRKGLWENAQDAMKHGAEHFRAYSDSGRESKHDLKWAVLSVHQAAECFCNILIIDITPDEKALVPNGKVWFPSLRRSTALLLDGRASGVLNNEEVRLITLYQTLPDIRDQLTHRTLPNDVEACDAAMSLLGTLRIAQHRMGPCLSEYNMDSPRIEAEIHHAIPYKRHAEYVGRAYSLLKSRKNTSNFGICGQCGTNSIDMGVCQICYTEYESAWCPECGEETYYQSWESPMEVECSCGCKFNA